MVTIKKDAFKSLNCIYFLHKWIDPDTHKKCYVTDIYNYVEKYELSCHGHSLLREKPKLTVKIL